MKIPQGCQIVTLSILKESINTTIATIAEIDSDSTPDIVIIAIVGNHWQNENLVSI